MDSQISQRDLSKPVRSPLAEGRKGRSYRTERYEVFFCLKISPEMDAALIAAGDGALMRQSDFLRLVMKEGLKAWKANPEARKSERFGVCRGVNITPEMRAEFAAEGKKAQMRRSDFARLILVKGLKAWQAQRTPDIRKDGVI